MTPLDLIETCNMEIKENISYKKKIERAQVNLMSRFNYEDTMNYYNWVVKILEQRVSSKKVL